MRTGCNWGLSSFGSVSGPRELAFAELEALAGAGLAGLLALFFTRVAAKQTRLFQRGAQGRVNLDESAGKSERECAGLADESAAVGLDLDVEFLDGIDGLQGTYLANGYLYTVSNTGLTIYSVTVPQ